MKGEGNARWGDRKVQSIYSLAQKSTQDSVRRELLKILGAMERTGNAEAGEAIHEIRTSREGRSRDR